MVKRRVLDPKPIFDEPSLRDFLDEHNVKPTHLGKIWRHVVTHPDCHLDQIPGIPQNLREPLARHFTTCSSEVAKCEESAIDGTIKLLIRLQDGGEVEAVMIRHSGEAEDPAATQQDRCGQRDTLCLSSQIGCRLGCTFCATGTLGLEGNLWPGEILEQLVHARARRQIQNVVFMGMGEPLENYNGVVSAIHGLVDPQRFGLAPRNITVSTVGLIGNMKRMMSALPQIKLALSLHAPNQKLREQIVPIAKSYKLDDLMATLDEYAASHESDGKRKGMIMTSYVLLKDVNDSDEHAHELVSLLQHRPVIVNLIPYNAFDGNAHQYDCPSAERTDAFLKILLAAGMRVFERRHHGRDISAACGQLARIQKTPAVDVEDCNGKLAKDRLAPGNPTIEGIKAPSSRRVLTPFAAVAVSVLATSLVGAMLWRTARRRT